MDAEEEDLNKEVEVEEEAERLPTDLLNVLRMTIRDNEVDT